jgi:hypothetical protein
MAAASTTSSGSTSRECFRQVRAIYEVFGAADRVEHDVFPGDHSLWGKRGIPFLVKYV